MEGLRKRVTPEISFNRDKKYGSQYLENLQQKLDAGVEWGNKPLIVCSLPTLTQQL